MTKTPTSPLLYPATEFRPTVVAPLDTDPEVVVANPFWGFDGNMYYIYDPASPSTYKILTKLESGSYEYTP